ncbi:response regulator [Aquisalinus flavus]|uniref:Response regulator n=1 Tax=Aquisalinus flavus TaxID=1526572 RepID=A0A8J2V5T5_9PROT|nr:response regulator [Aquisalinus flavus]MBD0426950.1 response regulator [Aquisalinus flavus]GGC97186.1 response regulator [Aquisalinus flavus]
MKSVLIIEDDISVAEAVSFVLERNGFRTTRVETGAAAAALLKSQHFCGALVDVWLGEEDGLDVLASLRAQGNTLPVVVMSGGGPGHTLESVSARADVLDACAVLFKPFTDEELLDAVNRSCPDAGCAAD